MAEASSSTASSPSVLLESVLNKLANSQFSSQRIARHVEIRSQISLLLQDKPKLEALASALISKIRTIIQQLPTGMEEKSLFRHFWAPFHREAVSFFPEIWKKIAPETDTVLAQMATSDLGVLALKQLRSLSSTGASKSRDERRLTISIEEENAIRYVAGYVLLRMRKKYGAGNDFNIQRCIISMNEDDSHLPDADDNITFLDYTSAWISIVNRGGLFFVNEHVYIFFLELELCAYPLLMEKLASQGPEDMQVTAQTIAADANVCLMWSAITSDLSSQESRVLLLDICKLWLTVRGHSLAAKFLEDYKKAVSQNTKKQKSLRKQLKFASKEQQQ